MKKNLENYAFIDAQNVNLGIQTLGWKLDWRRFRCYLTEKYAVDTAYLFMGYIESNQDLYQSLQKAGFILIFKKVLHYKDGTVKGNCDAELVLQAMIDFPHYSKAILVTGDGDFACLARHLNKQQKLLKILVPNKESYSALLKEIGGEHLDFMNNLQKKLSYKKSTP